VHKPREQALDTELMVTLAGYGVQLAKGLTPGASAVSAGDFLAKLRLAHGGGMDDAPDASAPANPNAFAWAALGASVRKYFRWAPSCAPHMCVRGRRFASSGAPCAPAAPARAR
jgi:hypothetical protein